MYCLRNKGSLSKSADGMKDPIEIETIHWLCATATIRSMREILPLSGGSKCSDPRERIFANLGMITQQYTDFAFVPDYTQSVSAVYQNFFREWMKYSHRADLLGLCRSDTRLESSPSWTPNWNSGIPNLRFQHGREASGLSSCHWRFIDSNTLELAGVVVATAKEVKAPETSILTYGVIVANIRKFAPDSLGGRYPTGCTILDAYTTVLRMDRF